MARIFKVTLIMRRIEVRERIKKGKEVGKGNNLLAVTVSEWVEKEKRKGELRKRRK